MNILFMGTPDFAEEALIKIYNAGFNICRCGNKPDLICVVAYRKDFTKRNTRYTKVWLYKSACITSSKI